MFGIATIRETVEFFDASLPLSGIPVPFSTRQWEYPWCYSRLISLGLEPSNLVLDVGCGTNPFMIELAGRRVHVVGLDLYSDDDLRSPGPGWGFNRKLENECLTFCEANMTNIPYPDDYFDAVYSVSLLEHCDESTRRAGLREMLRVLKPRGPLVVTEDYIPMPIKPVPGIMEACARTMDYDFREHIALTGRTLADPSVKIPSDMEIAQMRDRGELLLNCVVAPREYYHFTSVGFVVLK